MAARSGLDPAGIATPRKTLEFAALALAEVSRWRIDRPAVLSQLERADPHRGRYGFRTTGILPLPNVS